MASVKIEAVGWTLTERDMRITCKVEIVSGHKSFSRVKNVKGDWEWRTEYGGALDPRQQALAESIILDHPHLCHIADYYGIKNVPQVDLRTIERDLRP